MAITLNGTTGISSPGGDTSTSLATTNLSYTGTLTGGTGVVAIGTNQIYKDASGNVGFGVTPSAWNSVYRAFDFGSLGGIASAANTVGIYTNVYVDSAFNSKYKTTNYATSYLQNSNGTGQHQWFIAPSGSAGGTISFTQAMTLDASGNLGLGATSISALGTGYTTMAVQGTNGAGFRLYAGATEYGRVYADATAMVFQSVGVQPQVFYLNGSERVRIDSSGRLLVGTTSAPVAGALFRAYNAANADFSFGPNGSSSFIVYNSSSVGVYLSNGTQAWAGSSDERLKTDLITITNAVQKVATLRAVTGRFKTDAEGFSRAFLIAQDLQKVLPEAVDASDPEKLGVRYTDTIPLLVAAIKELTTRLEALEAKA